ncbi:transglutaminase-like cysteine peptidase [Alsobacter soli]|uniref:transglutaminase-like cysteine peptidase n=1 Tax=Alsobacter soli TaxID=2109933 RepID=UPI001304D7A9|nr:transglutaminase-like cysteine peptidase [Alsobacter soli]
MTAEASNQARVIPAAVTAAPVLEEAKPPIGWIDFCPTHADDCEGQTLPAKKITLNAATWAELVRVNQQVNNDIEQVEDIALYGVSEKWTYPDEGKGDCEDIALLKRRMLMHDGLPRQALLMTVVRDETGAGHAILTVVTDRGDFVLDSKTSRIMGWEATGYGFIKRQSQEHPNLWVKLGEPAPSSLIVAGH